MPDSHLQEQPSVRPFKRARISRSSPPIAVESEQPIRGTVLVSNIVPQSTNWHGARARAPRSGSEDPLSIQSSPVKDSFEVETLSNRRSARRTGTIVEVVVPGRSAKERSRTSKTVQAKPAPATMKDITGLEIKPQAKARPAARPAPNSKHTPTRTTNNPHRPTSRSPSPSPSPSPSSSIARISSRVPRPSRRALESGLIPSKREKVQDLGGDTIKVPSGKGLVNSGSPLKYGITKGELSGGSRDQSSRRNASPSPTNRPSNSNSSSGSASDPDSDSAPSPLRVRHPQSQSHNNAQAQARFLAHERTVRSREARNFVWRGEVNEPRRLRGGKVLDGGGLGAGTPGDSVESGRGRREGSGRRMSDASGAERMDVDEKEDDLAMDGGMIARGRKFRDRLMDGRGKDIADELEETVEEEQFDVGISHAGDSDGLDDLDQLPLGDDAERQADEDDIDELMFDDLPGRNGKRRDIDPALADLTYPPRRFTPIERENLTLSAIYTLQRVLATLSCTPTHDPPPFPLEPDFASVLPRSTNKEDRAQLEPGEEKERMKKYEALGQLVGLLMGTVGRGEGNSCLVLGARGSGKTRTVNRAIALVSDHLGSTSGAGKRPIVVRLDGIAQTNDMVAIREMGRQIAIGEGRAAAEEEGEDREEGLGAENYAPTTLPAHLLALLTEPSERAIVIVIEHFDLFTQHARQALLYCLLDVVQSVRPGSSATTGRGVAVIGVTSRVDTTLLLEKRVKSRFSQRIFRVAAPLAGGDLAACKDLLKAAMFPDGEGDASDRSWSDRWVLWVEEILNDVTVGKALQRLIDISTDLRVIYRPLISPVIELLSGTLLQSIGPDQVLNSFHQQMQESGWHAKSDKLKGLSAPALVVLIIAKHFSYAGKEEFNFAMAEHEYRRFAQASLAGSGRARWSEGILRMGWDQLLRTGLLLPATRFRPNPNPYMRKFQVCRSLLSRNEIVAYFKGPGTKVLGTELSNWGRTAGGHA